VLGGAPGNEQDGVLITNLADVADCTFGSIEDATEFLTAVRMLEQTNAGTVEVPDGFLRSN
jgi:hypothetical protein